MTDSKTYWATDGDGGDCVEGYGTPESVAREYVETGNWGEQESTIWIDVQIFDDEFCGEDDLVETVTVALHPEEPECDHENGHIWGTPHCLVGGCEGSPGIKGHGGGTVGVDICMLCGLARHWDNWAQRPDTGEQGLYSIRYETEEYGADVVDSDDDHAVVEIGDSCFLVSLKRETYINTYDGMNATVNGQRYAVNNGRWEEVDDDEEN